MAELKLAYEARTYSSGTLGRALCNARGNHWVADDSGGEAVGAGEMFMASLSACAVNMVQRIAHSEGRHVGHMEVTAAAYRDFDQPQGDITLYDAVKIDFQFQGTAREDAQYLVKTWKQR